MTSEPLVSIITPCYNHEKFIAQCIESVISQTYQNWEMIVVDDYSQDASFEIVSSYAAAEPRIKASRHDFNYGVDGLARTYNEALDLSSGELIAVLEGDDLWASDKLATQVPAFRDENVVLAYSDFDEISETGELIKRHRSKVARGLLRTGPSQNFKFFAQLKYLAPNTVIIRKNPLMRTGGFISADIPVVDYPTFLQLSLEGDFVRIPSVLAYYQRHADSVSFTNVSRIAEGSAEFMQRFTQDNQMRIRQFGLNTENLYAEVERALQQQQRTAHYFEGKYQIMFGNSEAARKAFLRALISPKISFKHRAIALVGLISSVASRKLFLGLINLSEFFSPRS